MGRTPLMRALQRLARDHREAEALGMPIEELRARREEAAYSRREFIKRTGTVGAAVAIAGPAALARPARAATNGTRIAVVGGGIAGLACALTLQDKGVVCDVYESHPTRFGGRMHSDYTEFDTGFWGGQQAELCGELIDTNHKTILQLAQRFGLATVDLLGSQPNGSEDTYYVLGSTYPKSQADIDFRPVKNTLQGQVQQTGYPTLYNDFTPAGQFFDNMTVHDWIANYVPGGQSSPFGTLLNNAYNEEYGAETTDQAALNLMYLLGFNTKPGNFSIYGKSDERYHIVGGNSKLPEAIARALPDRLHTGHRLTSIAANADGSITLTFETGPGSSVVKTFDQVVLCMHFAVLRTLDYRKAGFDPLKKTAITQLGAGLNSKLNMQFTSRYWNDPKFNSTGSVYTDLPLQSGWDVTRGQDGSTGIFVAYPGANVAKSLGQSNPYSTTLTNTQVAKFAGQFVSQLDKIWPGIANRYSGKAMLSTPFTDPNFNCSYSYWKPGQYTGFSGYEKQRQGNIHFAGEHCSQDFQGFMEGGAAEGVRAASEILGDLK